MANTDQEMFVYLGDWQKAAGMGSNMHVILILYSSLCLTCHLCHAINYWKGKYGTSPKEKLLMHLLLTAVNILRAKPVNRELT